MEPSILSIKHLVSEAQCYETIRQLRWQEGVSCPHCDSRDTIRRGFADSERHLQRYECKTCQRRFDDLTGTVLSGHHQPLSVWVLCLYFMGLNLSNTQIAQELDLNKDDVQAMTECLRNGIAQKKNA
jgi:transposase-like protein